jgi:hypothetical protein
MSVCSIYLTCVFEIKYLSMHQERKPYKYTQIPLMGMEKLGTKGFAFIATITLRTKFSLIFSFKKERKRILITLDLEKTTRKEEMRETSLMEFKPPGVLQKP